MNALQRWKSDPDVSPPSAQILQRSKKSGNPKSEPSYVLTAAQLQQRVFAETTDRINPQNVPALLQELASNLGYRLELHEEGGDQRRFQFIPLEVEPARGDIPAIARKVLIDLGAAELPDQDRRQRSIFWANLLEVMRALHVWKNNPNVSPPSSYIYRVEKSSGSKPEYVLSAAQLQQRVFVDAAKLLISPQDVPPLLHEIASNLGYRLVYRGEVSDYGAFQFLPLDQPAADDNSATTAAPIRDIERPEPQKHEPEMAQSDDIIFKPDGSLVKGGLPYRAVAEAAPEAQVHRTTLLRWIREKTKFEGRPLQSYYFAPTHTYFVSEESIQRLSNRFVKWPSEEPAGPVTLGETKDKSGFIGMSEAADIAGTSRRTMWLWASQGKAPTDKALDVIQCPASDHFYIRERDAYELRKLVPRSGLQRGRRSPQLAPQP